MGIDEAAGRASSAGADAARSAATGRFVLLVAAGWLGAILLVRLLLTGGAAWALFFLLLPVPAVLLVRRFGAFPASLALGAFVGATLLARAALTTPKVGWALFLLIPVALGSAGVALRVLGGMRPQQK